MRIGVIGTGRMGSFHAATLRGLDRVSDLIVADADEARARAVAAEIDAEATRDLEAVLAMKPDGIVVAAATPESLAITRRALAAEVAVFCEKPVTLDTTLCRELVDEVTATGVVMQVGFQRRFDREFQLLRDSLLGGRLGRPFSVRMLSCDAEPPHPSYVPTSGGIFKDLQIHDFDLLHWLTGQRVVEVFSMGVSLDAAMFAEHNDFASATTLLRLADDTLVTMVAGRYNHAGYDVRVEVAGTTGTASAGLGARTPLRPSDRLDDESGPQPYGGFIDRFREAYVAEMSAFLDLLQGRIANPCPPPAALSALVVADAARLSADRGRPVVLDEVSIR